MSTPEERQAARDRAADAIAHHHEVRIDKTGWPAPPAHPPGISRAEQRAPLRARAKAEAAQCS